MASDFLVRMSVQDFFQSSKNATWREQVRSRQTRLFGFLRDHRLLLVDPLDENGKARQDFTLMRSHLTDDGFELFKKTVPSWEKARDKDGNLDNVAILEKGLEKIRAA
jgi:hypothetical protein